MNESPRISTIVPLYLFFFSMLVLSSGSLPRYGLHRVFRFAKAAGYDGVDIEISKIFDTQDAGYIKELIEQNGIPVVALLVPSAIAKKEAFIKYIELAKEIGASIVATNPPRLFDFEFTQWLKNELPGIRRREKIHVAMMNAVPSRVFGFLPEHALNSPSDLKKFHEVCMDTSNVFSLKEDLIRFYEKLKNEIIHIFLSNVRGGKDHTLPMDGSLPLESLLTKLKKDNYQGALSVRVSGKDLGEGNEEKVIQHLLKIKEFVKEYYTA